MGFEARIGSGEWYELAEGPRTHDEAAQVFAEYVINQEWKDFDLRHAEMLAKEQIVVRDGDDYRLYKTSKVKLCLKVSTQSACTDNG